LVSDAIEIKEGVYWVGAIDYNVREFHGYTTPYGTTYNSYLVIDEKTALIDTVKSPFKDELLSRISQVIPPKEIDYLIVNHVEMDHSSSATAVMEKAPDAQVISSKKGEEFLHAHYEESDSWDIMSVDSTDQLKLGKRSLSFIPAPMLHWPDTMFTYVKSEKLLFSNDGFGQHIATPERFSDEVGERNIFGEAKKYYANILMPFSNVARKKLDELKTIDVEMICPSHGLIFRKSEEIKKIVSLYKDWSSALVKEKAVIAYDTMYRSTEKMARAIEEGLNAGGVETRIFNIRASDMSEIMSEILDSRAIIVGSSTLNNGLLPSVGGFLTYLKGLRPRGRIGAAFGSFGWGGGAVKTITEYLQEAGLELPEIGFQTKWVPGVEEQKKSFEFGKTLAEQIRR
jgi:flavorubredoxin